MIGRGCVVKEILLKDEYRTLYLDSTKKTEKELTQFLNQNKIEIQQLKYQYFQDKDEFKGGLALKNPLQFDLAFDLLVKFDNKMNVNNLKKKTTENRNSKH